MSKQIAVTGAAGFIGRNIVERLNQLGHDDLILVDSLGSEDKWKNLVGLRYEDILSPQAFLSLTEQDSLDGMRAVIHLGACSATTERDADYLLRNNYRYTRVLCEWCLKNSTRFVYASSAATYGDGSQGYCDTDSATIGLRPLNMYGYSKHMFDLWALKHGLLNKIAGLKYFNVFGPYEEHKGDMRSVVSKAYAQILEHGKVELFKSYRPEYADGEQMRDFIYVKDAVAVTLHFALDSRKCGLFNCGTGKARTWRDLVTAVYSAMNLPPKIEFIPMPEQLQGKYQYFTQADISRLRNAGYTADFYRLEDAVADYIQNYPPK